MHDYDIHETLFLDWEIHDPCARGSESLSRVNMHTEWKCIEFYNIFFFTFTVVGDWYYVHSVLFFVLKLWNSLPMGKGLWLFNLGGGWQIWPYSEHDWGMKFCFQSKYVLRSWDQIFCIWLHKSDFIMVIIAQVSDVTHWPLIFLFIWKNNQYLLAFMFSKIIVDIISNI